MLLPLRLDLNELAQMERPGLTCHEGGRLAEAAAVVADKCGKALPQPYDFTDGAYASRSVVGPDITPVMVRSLGDLQEATEWGACAIAIKAMEELESLTVYERSPKSGFGFDYFMGPLNLGERDSDNFFIEATHTMEVSGTIQDNEKILDRKSDEKIERLKKKAQPLPAFVFVVDFKRARAKVTKYV